MNEFNWSDFFTLYNFTAFLCCCFWWYFDQLSNMMVRYKNYLIGKEGRELSEYMQTSNVLTSHLISKGIFYVSMVFFVFNGSTTVVACSIIAFFIGVQLSKKFDPLEEIAMNSIKQEKPLEDKLLTYSTISNISFVAYVAMITFL